MLHELVSREHELVSRGRRYPWLQPADLNVPQRLTPPTKRAASRLGLGSHRERARTSRYNSKLIKEPIKDWMPLSKNGR